MITKQLGVLGPDRAQGDVQEIRCLNRIIRWIKPPFKPTNQSYIEWEPDPRHIEILLAQLGLDKERTKGLTVTGVKEPKNADTTPVNADEREM